MSVAYCIWCEYVMVCMCRALPPAVTMRDLGFSGAGHACWCLRPAYVAKKATSPAPVKITAVSPQKGPATATVKIFGSGLGSTTSGNGGAPDVTFGGLPASVQGSWTDTVVRVTLPPGLPQGTADVQVVTPDGRTATLPNAFELTP